VEVARRCAAVGVVVRIFYKPELQTENAKLNIQELWLYKQCLKMMGQPKKAIKKSSAVKTSGYREKAGNTSRASPTSQS